LYGNQQLQGLRKWIFVFKNVECSHVKKRAGTIDKTTLKKPFHFSRFIYSNVVHAQDRFCSHAYSGDDIMVMPHVPRQ